jgi:hypothetical protein
VSRKRTKSDVLEEREEHNNAEQREREAEVAG